MSAKFTKSPEFEVRDAGQQKVPESITHT